MSENVPPFTQSVAPKELAYALSEIGVKRSAAFVRKQCKSGEYKTHPVGKPYEIPASEANRILGIENARTD